MPMKFVNEFIDFETLFNTFDNQNKIFNKN